VDDNKVIKSREDSVDTQFPITLLGDSNSVAGQRFYDLRKALESEEYKRAEGSLKFPIGRDDSGKFIIADLNKLPHIMAGGQTGSGKSNFTEGTYYKPTF